jgi:hypothetical protein
VLGGLIAGAGAAWFVAADPGYGHGAPGTLRGDLEVMRNEMTAVGGRLDVAQTQWRIAAERIDKASAQGTAQQATAADIRALADDLRRLRDDVHGELLVVDARLADLRRRMDEASAASGAPAGGREAPPSQEDEDRWVTRSRDSDAGVRFSAVQRLGRVRTDRAVQVAIERLGDDDPGVVWQAVRNLGQFRERDAAAQVAQLLDNVEKVLRAAAYDALVAMGAPKDTGFEATAPVERRRAAADALKKWAETP